MNITEDHARRVKALSEQQRATLLRRLGVDESQFPPALSPADFMDRFIQQLTVAGSSEEDVEDKLEKALPRAVTRTTVKLAPTVSRVNVATDDNSPTSTGCIWKILFVIFFLSTTAVGYLYLEKSQISFQQQSDLFAAKVEEGHKKTTIKNLERHAKKLAEDLDNADSLKQELETGLAKLTADADELKADVYQKRAVIEEHTAMDTARGFVVCVIDSTDRKKSVEQLLTELDSTSERMKAGDMPNVLIDQEPVPTKMDQITDRQLFLNQLDAKLALFEKDQVNRIIPRRPDMIVAHWHALRPVGFDKDPEVNEKVEKSLLRGLCRIVLASKRIDGQLPKVMLFSRGQDFGSEVEKRLHQVLPGEEQVVMKRQMETPDLEKEEGNNLQEERNEMAILADMIKKFLLKSDP